MALASKKFRTFKTSLSRQTLPGLLLLMGAVLISVGCSGEKIGTVEGTVTLDGGNLDGGSVTFSPVSGGTLSYGTIATDGSFHLQTASIHGVIPGEYIATVSCRRGHPSPGMSEKEIDALEKIPIRYCKPNTSDLRFNIKPGPNSLELKMSSK